METLIEYADNIRKCMSNRDTGPSQIASMVLALDGEWPKYKDQAPKEQRRFTAWLTHVTGNRGRNIAYFRRLQAAIDGLSELLDGNPDSRRSTIRNSLNHEFIVWLWQSAPSEYHKVALMEVLNAKRMRGAVLARDPSKRIAQAFFDRSKYPTAYVVCLECIRRQKLIDDLTGAAEAAE